MYKSLNFGVKGSKDKDDPMGLSAMHQGERQEEDYEPFATQHTQNEPNGKGGLDAVGNGKGKGKNDGKCNICQGDGHYARDYPTPPGPGASDIKCHGCNGKGHVKSQCPTVNP